MEAAVGAANWVVGMVLNKLSDELMAGYMASRELGLNMDQIKRDLNYMLALLQAAEGRDIADNLADLCNKADEAEDVLDELHYFVIRDELDGTREATPDLGDGLGAQLQHARHAARNTAAGNYWLSCFSSCCRSQSQQDDTVTGNNRNSSMAISKTEEHDQSGANGHIQESLFDRVAMSKKIKSLIQDVHSLCPPISDLLQKCSPCVPPSMERPNTSSVITQNKLYGRDAIFDQTMEQLLKGGAMHHTQNYIMSVLPIVGPGGVGKTTFAQHLYNDHRTKQHFTVMIWVCVSTTFDVTELTTKILNSLNATESQGTNIRESSLDQLHKSIQDKLKSKRFLIVFDDIWEHDFSKAASTKRFSKTEWEKLLAPFGTGETNGNMVLVTTRFPKVAETVKKGANQVDLHGLEPDEFWDFFQLCAFSETQDDNDKEKLFDIGKQIAKKLKCSPLAAKTVGPILRKKPTRKHWMEILEKEEWLKQKDGDDSIITALKISYDYLPFYLKKCFSYLALFPEDYEFDSLEISCYWDSIGIINSSGKNDTIEGIGSQYLNELYDNGFLMKGDDNHYVMHDLLHELSQIVSSRECANINYSSFRADDILPSIRHLSITIQDKYTESFKEEMEKIKKRVDIRNLRSVMIFGSYRSRRIANVVRDTLNEIRALRVLFIFMNSPHSLPDNFSKLVHLRYLKIGSPWGFKVCIPSTVSKLYHLKFLDLKSWGGSNNNLPNDFNRLINLRHFLAKKEFHSNVPEVGKMKCLQELKEFHVKKDKIGFELAQLGQLEQLRGELCIFGLKNATREEAIEAKLKHKSNLSKLRLDRGGNREKNTSSSSSRTQVVSNENQDDDIILDSLQPHSNLTELSIVNLGGGMAPSWLGSNIIHLDTLHLDGVPWATLAPFGKIQYLRELKLRNIVGMYQFGPDFPGGTTHTSFRHLKKIVFEAMPDFVKWVGGDDNSHSFFSGLERLECISCPKLNELPLSSCSSSSCTMWFPKLRRLNITRCLELSVPLVPHTSTLTYVRVNDSVRGFNTSKKLTLDGYNGALAFQNLGNLEEIYIGDVHNMSLIDFQQLRSLRRLTVTLCRDTFLRGLDEHVVVVFNSVRVLNLSGFLLTRKMLSNLFRCFPALYVLSMSPSKESHEEVKLQIPSSCSLKTIRLFKCKNLILLPLDDGQGLVNLTSLRNLHIDDCGKIFSQWYMGKPAQTTSNPFPSSLLELSICRESRIHSMALLSNLTALTSLQLIDCCNVTMDGFNPLITSNLNKLCISSCGSAPADLLAEMARTKTTMPQVAFQLKDLVVDSISAVLTAPICSFLAPTLHELGIKDDVDRVSSFSDEQEGALELLVSLKKLSFDGLWVLQSLPEGLHKFPSLTELSISHCPQIQSLPKNGLPTSLETFSVFICSSALEEEIKRFTEEKERYYSESDD